MNEETFVYHSIKRCLKKAYVSFFYIGHFNRAQNERPSDIRIEQEKIRSVKLILLQARCNLVATSCEALKIIDLILTNPRLNNFMYIFYQTILEPYCNKTSILVHRL